MDAVLESAPIVVAVAPDSFKGSCSSAEAASAIAEGVRAALGPHTEVRELPMADGGEGTLEALVSAWHGRVETVAVTDALGRQRIGRVGFSVEDGEVAHLRAIIEAADANGLPAVSDVPLQPLDADSAGVGALVLAALNAGADEILLCLGGSATNDGGAGLMRALGAKLLNSNGEEVKPGACGLATLHTIDLTDLDPRAAHATWKMACDVDNPLTGPLGAAAVFGPQKGATDDDVAAIDSGLSRLARVLVKAARDNRNHTDPNDLERTPGLGAAGGLGLGPVALFGAKLVPGAQLVSEAVGLEGALAGADLVITGEGRLDSQSLSGKVVSRVLTDSHTGASGAPAVMVIAGSVGLSASEARSSGITAAFSIASGPASLPELQHDVLRLLSEVATHASSAFLAGYSYRRR